MSISVSARSGVRAITTITPLKHSHVIWHYLLEFHSLQITMAGAYDVNVETESGPTIVGSFILIVSQSMISECGGCTIVKPLYIDALTPLYIGHFK